MFHHLTLVIEGVAKVNDALMFGAASTQVFAISTLPSANGSYLTVKLAR